MYREYDLFEKFPDGSSLWRASVQGLEGAFFHMHSTPRGPEQPVLFDQHGEEKNFYF